MTFATSSMSSPATGNACSPGKSSIPPCASVADLLQAPIVFLNGHRAPEFNAHARQNLREYVEQGGFFLPTPAAPSPSSTPDSSSSSRSSSPSKNTSCRPLSDDHPVWRAKHLLTPGAYPLWGIEHGCRTVVIYSPKDLSCYWNQAEHCPTNTAVILATRVGQNIIDYATGKELPADKLVVREVHDFKARLRPSGAPCGSPSSSTPASGTSPRWPCPT